MPLRFWSARTAACAGWSGGAIAQASAGDSCEEIDKGAWDREIVYVKQFMDFYFKDIDVCRANVALKAPKSLVFKRPEALGTVCDEVLEWMLKSMPDLSTSITTQLLSELKPKKCGTFFSSSSLSNRVQERAKALDVSSPKESGAGEVAPNSKLPLQRSCAGKTH